MRYNKFIIRHLGIYYMLIASMLFAGTGALSKILSSELSSIEIVFFRNIIGLFLIIFMIYQKPLHQSGGKFWLLAFRGIIGTIGLYAFFYNIAHIDLATAFTFSKTSPIFTALFAAFIFKERLNYLSWFAIFIGFVGILFVIEPTLGINKDEYIGLLSGIGAAMAYTSIRGLRKHYDTRAIVLSFMLCGSAIPLLSMIIGSFYYKPNLDFLISPFVMPSLNGWGLVIVMGLLATGFQIYLTKAYAASKKAGVVAAVGYSDVVFSMIFGLILGDPLPSSLAFLGIIMIIGAGVLVALRF
ncbi:MULTISPECIES: DMT family transporter [Campylobacter]|uniref:DMT family transporter n=1 Tax=Campylobacter porcelli TaxID=1660073 RepID=A0ABU7M4E0_9BACT|nr:MULTISPECIES: DMT family transporter [unclassified Campylobacter]MCR8679074.1 DMT family transporter [Campylobacter sp. RM19072]MEE3744572.1 DMT family transporter [Campylobacter sp. CX2-4855-23]MEE3776932.1 DMT family transporter [Campylobacter sp. CX2-4080-23]